MIVWDNSFGFRLFTTNQRCQNTEGKNCTAQLCFCTLVNSLFFDYLLLQSPEGGTAFSTLQVFYVAPM